MAKRLTQAQREEYAIKAVELCAKGWGDAGIGRHLGLNNKTVKKLREDEYAKRSEMRGNDIERHLASYTAVQRAAWERFEETPNRSLNASGYLNTIKATEDSKVKLTGAEAPKRHQVDVNAEKLSDEDLAFLREVETFVLNADDTTE